jgi:hypothetical protein
MDLCSFSIIYGWYKMSITSQNVSGVLYEWSAGNIELSHFKEYDCNIEFNNIPNTGWETFTYLSDVALRHEEKIYNIPGPYRYSMVIRRSGPRFLLLSENRSIATHFMEHTLSQILKPLPCQVNIAVDSLARNLAKNPTVYALSFIHARVPAFGTSLRSISFYGDDLGTSTYFVKSLELFNVHTCGLRHAQGGHEIVRIGSDGGVSFLFSNEKAIEVEKLLGFLRNQKYLSTSF